MKMDKVQRFFQSPTHCLIVACVVVFFALNALYPNSSTGFELYFKQNPLFKPWQFISYLFLHSSINHLLFNMIGLWSFGRVLEKVWGGKRFLIFYLCCGVGAALIYMGINYFEFNGIYQQLVSNGFSERDINNILTTGSYNPSQLGSLTEETLAKFYGLYNSPAVGASGAIYGVLVAFALMFPDYKIMLIFLPVPIAAKFFVPVLLLVDLFSGVTGFSIFGANVAHFAHIGGAIVGFLLVMYWKRQ